MAILVPRWLGFSCRVRLQMCIKFCMVKIAFCMGSPSQQYDFDDGKTLKNQRFQTFSLCIYYLVLHKHGRTAACLRVCMLLLLLLLAACGCYFMLAGRAARARGAKISKRYLWSQIWADNLSHMHARRGSKELAYNRPYNR